MGAYHWARVKVEWEMSLSRRGCANTATVVGVLVEVPVMLSVVRIVKASRGWYERG